MHKPKGVNVVAERLVKVVVEVVPLAHGAEVARRINQRHVHVEVVGVLDALHDLQDLVAEVLHALLRHHKVVLHGNGQALAHGVAREGLLALRERARGGLVGHARGEALVEAPHVPLNFLVGVLHVHVREDDRRKGALRRIDNEAVDAVGQELARAEEDVGDVHAPALAVAVLVLLHVVGAGPKHVGPLFLGGLEAVAVLVPVEDAVGECLRRFHCGCGHFACSVHGSCVRGLYILAQKGAMLSRAGFSALGRWRGGIGVWGGAVGVAC